MGSDYPVNLNLAGRCCVVVGAGPVGLRKVMGLLEAGADVVLIDPELNQIDYPVGIKTVDRAFLDTDLDDAFLVYAATGDRSTNQQIAAAARCRSILVNVVDDSAESDFVIPASFRKGNLVFSVSTGGVSPAVAVMVRDEVESLLPGSWQIFLEIAGILRARLLTSGDKATYNQQVLRNLVRGGILAMIDADDLSGIDRLIEMEIGEGFSLADLGVSISKGSP